MLGPVFLGISCTALPSPGAPGEGGTITLQDLPSTDVVPLEWGALVSTSPVPGTNASALWFQDDSGTVRMVGFDHQTQRLWAQAGVLRRR